MMTYRFCKPECMCGRSCTSPGVSAFVSCCCCEQIRAASRQRVVRRCSVVRWVTLQAAVSTPWNLQCTSVGSVFVRARVRMCALALCRGVASLTGLSAVCREFSVTDNRLTALPDSLADAASLQCVYAPARCLVLASSDSDTCCGATEFCTRSETNSPGRFPLRCRR
jgi:hypothetical protein